MRFKEFLSEAKLASYQLIRLMNEPKKDKEQIVKVLLTALKNDTGGKVTKRMVKYCRDRGVDYPEFKAIEKSAIAQREKNEGS